MRARTKRKELATRVLSHEVAAWNQLTYEEIIGKEYPHVYVIKQDDVDLDVEVLLLEMNSKYVHVVVSVTPVADLGCLLGFIPIIPVGPSEGIIIYKSGESAS